MSSRLREWVTPAYLLACLVLGGSAQGIWGNLLLQITGLAIIAWAALVPADEPLTRGQRWLFGLVLAALAVVAIQLIPLPAALWTGLGGRGPVASGFDVLGRGVPAMPLSLAPYDSLATVFELIPPIAMLCAILRLKAYRPSLLIAALVAGMLGGVLLGILQAASTDPESSPWYLYDDSTSGVATGFFANANHMAMLLLVTIPFLAAMVAAVRRGNLQRLSAAAVAAAGIALIVLVGLFLSKSIAGYLLALPVLAGSAAILFPVRSGWMRLAAASGTLLLVLGIVLMVRTPVGESALGGSQAVSSRAEMAETTMTAIAEFLPFGSGLGTFQPVYKLFEDQARIESVFVNHAHNEYLEIALELGIPGIVLMILFLGWWLATAWRLWRSGESDALARAAAVASAVLLAHSLVEFPLRSIALGASFGMFVALMAARRVSSEADKSHLWPTRHVVLK